MTTATQPFAIDAFARAIEHRDTAAQLAAYAPDAVVEIVDRDHPPSTPLVVSGTEAIGALLADVNGRDLTHQVSHALAQPDSASFHVACRYPDGSRVACSAHVELRDGLIVRQTQLVAWDG